MGTGEGKRRMYITPKLDRESLTTEILVNNQGKIKKSTNPQLLGII